MGSGKQWRNYQHAHSFHYDSQIHSVLVSKLSIMAPFKVMKSFTSPSDIIIVDIRYIPWL